jgi:ferritin
MESKDYRVTQFLDWFIKEQGEEEASIGVIIKKAELIGIEGKGIYMLDQELAARVYSPPSLVL